MARKEDLRLITGTGRYSADWSLPDQLHMHVLRSPHAHADIVSLDPSAAARMPGVARIFTADDVKRAGYGTLIGGVGFKGRGGGEMKRPHYGVLASGRVRFVGEPVAMVLATSAEAAQDAAERIAVEYRERPCVIGFDTATALGAPLLHDDIAGNLAFDFEAGDPDAAARAFAGARHVTRLTLDSQRLVGNPMEPRACAVRFDAASGVYTLYSSLQGLGGMRGQIAKITGVPEDKLRVDTLDVGGSFGVRSTPYPEYLVGMIAARELGRAVKWVGTRAEVFLSDYHGRALSLAGEIALDADGNILALRWDDRVDLGAYASPWGAFIGTNNLVITMGGVYKAPVLYARTRLAYTNTMPVSAYRGAGRPDIAYAIERLIDQAAVEHGFDPIALRRRNFIAREAMPYKTANGTVYDSGDFAGTLDDGLKHADLDGFTHRRAAATARGRLRGIGIATYLEAGGGGSAPKDQIVARFNRDGSLTLYSAAQSSGQGHETSFAEIVAGGLGIDIAAISVRQSDASVPVIGNGAGGSRSLLGQGGACRVLVDQLISAGRPHAARALGADEAQVKYADGAYRAGGKSVAFLDLARSLAGATPHPLDTVAECKFGMCFPNGCHVAEVEVDPETGEVRIERYTAVDDLGNVISPQLVEGQVHGGVVQGAGQALLEHTRYDEQSGQLLTGSFMDYAMPRAGIIRSFAVHEHPVPTETNVLGAKGVGESGCSGSLPAIMNAVNDALRQAGAGPMDMPATPNRVWHALHAAR